MIEEIRICITQAFIKIFGKNTRISDKQYNQILYRLRTGKNANLDCPKTFNEHILARKVFMNEDDLTQYTDKYEVRFYVEKTIGSQFLVKNFGVWENPEEICFDKLPQQYVLKATHGSGWNIIVRNGQKVNAVEIVSKLKGFLKENYYTYGREKNYRLIKPRIICEEFIEGVSGRSIIDFKVFCFGGCAKFYSVTYFENGKQHFNIFDLSDGRLEIKDRYERVNCTCLPPNIAEITHLAQELAKPFDFVRVDFYIAKQGIFFSELTFHSGGGIRPIKPIELDYKLGRYFDMIGGS